MPDSRSNRGPDPRDDASFRPQEIPRLRQANDDYCWMLSRGYPGKASLKLVGDRFALRDRQRRALQRCAADDTSRSARLERQVGLAEIAGRPVAIDGYNVLLTVEAALSGAVLLLARDGAMRDLASMSHHYKRVRQTRAAIGAIGGVLVGARAAEVTWYLDRPVSNSARLRDLIASLAAEQGWRSRVELEANVDQTLISSPAVVASADSAILDRCRSWLNLARLVVESRIADPWIVDLSGGSDGEAIRRTGEATAEDAPG